jgi:CRP-like cAMP-binding protein
VTGLQGIGWLNDLGADGRALLRSRATRHEFDAGATVFAPTQDPHSVYLLEQGRIRILRLSKSGHEVTLGYVMSSEVFGELPGMGDHPRESFAVARAPSIVWKIPLELFRGLINTYPSIAVEMGVREVFEFDAASLREWVVSMHEQGVGHGSPRSMERTLVEPRRHRRFRLCSGATPGVRSGRRDGTNYRAARVYCRTARTAAVASVARPSGESRRASSSGSVMSPASSSTEGICACRITQKSAA